MRRFLPVFFLILFPFLLRAQVKILFNSNKAESAGNADWVIDADLHNIGYTGGPPVAGTGTESNPQQIPTPAQSGITSSTAETYWYGGISAWGIDLVKKGYIVESLPYNGAITYGNTSNPQDLSNYKVFIDCEPNILYTDAEKTAIMLFVQNGGGLFMVADHASSDRNNDGYDSPEIWNDLMSSNTVQTNPFGITFDNASFSQTTTNIPSLPTDPILHGIMGDVTSAMWSSGNSMTLTPTANSSVKGILYKTGSSFGNTNVMFAYATFGNGKVAAIGDSSPCDDGTGDSGDVLYNGWTGDAGGNHERLIMNATIWLATSSVAAPVLTTTAVASVTPTGAVSGGTITSDGGSAITARGICWGTAVNPVVTGNHSTNGSGTGTFVSTITGLAAGTTYHIRAYATNANGTFYGNDLSFSTLCVSITGLPFAENFSAATLPSCWSQVDHTGNGQVWTFGTMTGVSPLPALTGSYTYLNSDGYGSGYTQNADLVLPVFDLTGYTMVNLSFNHYFRSYTGSSGTVSYSTNNGSTWTTLATYTATTANPASVTLAVSGAAMQSQVLFRWNYTGTYGYYWAVDDVQITGTACTPMPVSVTVSASQDTVCAGTPATFTATPVNGGTAPSYQWKINDGNATNAGNATYTYIPADGDVVSCVVTSSIYCASGNPATGSYTVSVNPPLPAQILLKNVTLAMGSGDCQAAKCVKTADSGSVFIVQSGGAATLIAGDSILLRPGTTVQPGGYLHAYITTHCIGCNTPLSPVTLSEKGEKAVQPGERISGSGRTITFRIFPNPAEDKVTLVPEGLPDGPTLLAELVSVTGEKILVQPVSPTGPTTFSLTGFRPGIYLVRLNAGDASAATVLIRR
ncbi:MAG TPA: choice-of-anchor J domain-containing protein [Bacteroidales bacterium]|nr:choice-of-anchor J domain-containing protein [Bacteroidales bacterium]HPS61407.1 choice-of-anchor J domain-containing protein [Bacteroidales bacterium]